MRSAIRIVLLVLCLAAPALADDTALHAFAQRLGLRDIQGFVSAVEGIRETGRLPQRWITKEEAEELGWRPGEDLCDSAPGSSIGGDRFGNRERRLPDRPGRRWHEADLDFACGRRGARRLVWSSDGLIYVTIDHYDSFVPVPR
jgi:hypothetical protein